MAKDYVLQVRMDSMVREKAEMVYNSMGTSLAEAVRVFAVQSIEANGYPFLPKASKSHTTSAKGSLSAFAKPELIGNEKDAFADAMVKKHE